MVTSMRMWVSLAALAVMGTWSPSANHQMLPHLWVCAAAAMVALASFSVKSGFETPTAFADSSAVGKQITEWL
jgi:hypothetical protein